MARTFLLVSIPLVLASCATAVTFNVEHPPLVDLRNANTITVIPFEWTSTREYEGVSKQVTSALISGMKRGKIDFVDPYPLQNIHRQNYPRYADVYVTGRITTISSYRDTETREVMNYWGEIIRKYYVTRTVSVFIEYTYIRSVDNQALGSFSKTATSSATSEYSGRRYGRRRGYGAGAFRQSGSWNEGIAVSAAQQFKDTMSHELGPWTTTEKRGIKRIKGKYPQVKEARKLVRQNHYDEALTLYSGVYEETGNVSAGYNTAVLFEAIDYFAVALELLEELSGKIAATGKKSPLFITKEIQKIKEFINGFVLLESYQKESIFLPVLPEAAD